MHKLTNVGYASGLAFTGKVSSEILRTNSSGLATLPPCSILLQLVPLQTQALARSSRREVLYDMQMHYDSSIQT
jgi:hypothetical protein